MTFDLDAYCRRIGYAGPREPSLETLRAVHALHPQAIAFENLDVLLRRPIPLDLASLQEKLVAGGRGGYCFEQNLVLAHALRALGFRLRELTGRVRYRIPDGIVLGRTHLLLLIDVDGCECIADVGFGGNVMTGPLLLRERGEQATPHEVFRIVAWGDGFMVQIKMRDSWMDVYSFTLDEQFPADIELGNWYTSTHPESRFCSELIVSRTAPGRRNALHNNELAVHALDGATERRTLRTAAELRDALTDIFRLSLPAGAEVDTMLARFTDGAVQ